MKLKGQLLTAHASLVLADGAAGETTITSAGTATRVFTLPDATTTAVGTDTTQTLSNKTFTAPVLGAATATSINGLTITSTTSGVLTIANSSTLATSGAYSITLTSTAATNVTLPTTGTLATLDGTETLTNKTLTTPVLGAATATSINKVEITAPATSATLTLSDGSSLITSGGHSITLTSTGATNVTLPTTGTIANLASAQVFSNKGFLTNAGGGAGCYFYDSGDATKRVHVALDSAATATNTTFNFVQTSPRVITFPDATVTLASVTGTETLTNKTLTSPAVNSGTLLTCTLDDYMLINEESAPSTPASGKVAFYAKTDKKLYTKDSAGTETQVGASGSGELNLIENGSDSNNWTETGARFNGYPTTTTTAGDLPLAGIIDTAIQIISSTTVAGDETTDYVSYAFTTPATLGAKLKVEFYMRPGSNFVASEWTVSVWDTAGPTRQALSTDSSSLTYLPNATGKFTTTFDATASTSYTLRFTRYVAGAASAATLNIANVIVGPGIQPQGAVVSETVSYSPTFKGSTGDGTVTLTTAVGYYSRVGTKMVGNIRLKANVVTSAPTGNLGFSLPGGFTVDSSKASADMVIGEGSFYDSSSGATNKFMPVLWLYNSTQSYCYAIDPGTAGALPALATGDELTVSFSVPIAEWAGSGTLNVAQNDVEYVANNGPTWNATNSADFSTQVAGPAGATVGGALTAVRVKRVRFATPIMPGDVVQVEIDSAGTGTWTVAGNDQVNVYRSENSVTYGIGSKTLTTITDVDVVFGQYRLASGATFGAAGTAWSTQKWRVKKVSGGQAVGFGLASSSNSGLVNPYGTTGVVYAGTYTPTVAAAANCSSVALTSAQYQRVGKIVTVTAKGTLTVTTTATDTSLTLTLPVSTANFSSASQAIGTGILVKTSANVRDAMWLRSTSGAATVELVAEATGVGTGVGCEWFATFTYEIQ